MFIRQKLLKRAYTDSVTNIVFFIVCKIYFLLVFWKLKYAEKVLRQPWNVLTLQISLSLRDRWDLVYFASLFRNEQVFLVFRLFFVRLVKRSKKSKVRDRKENETFPS